MSKMNDDLFEDVPYSEPKSDKAASQMDDSLFEDSPHPVLLGEMGNRSIASDVQAEGEAQKPPLPEVSTSRSALVGAGQGATFGFADEITAPFVAAAGMASDLPTMEGESTWEKYKRLMQTYRDVAREEQQAAQEQHPYAYTGGAIAGGIATLPLGGAALRGAGTVAKAALPAAAITKGAQMATTAAQAAPVATNIAKGVGMGAGYGGLAGAGEAEGSLEERIPQALEGAEMGAIVGGAVPVAGKALSTIGKTANKVTELPLFGKMKEAFSRGLKGENLVSETGRREASDIARSKAESLYNDIKELQTSVGGKIQDEIQMAKEAGEQVDLSQEIPEMLNRLDQIKREGSKEAAAYASSVEAEIKKILGIKPIQAADDGMLGVASKDLPEGLIPPKSPQQPPSYMVDPDKAQDLKQVMQNYSPRKNMAPQEIEPAGIAQELKSTTGDKLAGISDKLPELNQQYGAIKDSLKLLKVNEKQLPTQITEKINNVIAKLGQEKVTGDNARKIVEEVVENIRTVSPEIAEKYSKELNDIGSRLKLSEEIVRGMQSGLGLGTVQSFGKAGANLTGMALNKMGANTVIAGGKKAANLTKAVLDNPVTDRASLAFNTQGADAVTSAKKAVEPYQLQRKVANAVENAEPQFLQDHANQLRSQYGKDGERLATILDNMAKENKQSRRALMFTVLQNPQYRKMLGLIDDEQ